MNKRARLTLLLVELVLLAIVLRVLPAVTAQCRSIEGRLVERRREQRLQEKMLLEATDLREAGLRLDQLLKESSTYGLDPVGLNRLPQELPVVVGLAGLELVRFDRGEVEILATGREVIGHRVACSLELKGDFPSLLRFLWLQERRLPALNLSRLKVARPGSPTDGLSISIGFSAPMFEALASTASEEG